MKMTAPFRKWVNLPRNDVKSLRGRKIYKILSLPNDEWKIVQVDLNSYIQLLRV